LDLPSEWKKKRQNGAEKWYNMHFTIININLCQYLALYVCVASRGNTTSTVQLGTIWCSEICKGLAKTKPCQPSSVVKYYKEDWSWPKPKAWHLSENPNLGIFE
jgi:hypothetical protein